MEVDPEVAELLGDLPPTRLPEELTKAGWGVHTMEEMVKYGQAPPVKPSEVQQPTYTEHCVQCGRPITAARGNHWMDHAGDRVCDGALVDGWRYAAHHVTADELDFIKSMDDRLMPRIEVSGLTGPPATSKKFKDLKKKGDCSATKHHQQCAHQCAWPDDHFGFHECKHCRHLWK
jgi:hypothetical protein